MVLAPFDQNFVTQKGKCHLQTKNGHSSVGFDVMCCQMIEHHRSTLWPAPSQMERRSQAARQRLRRRPLIFRFGVRAALMGPPGLAKHETLVNAVEQETTTIADAPLEDVPDETEVITLGEQEDEPDRPAETDIAEHAFSFGACAASSKSSRRLFCC